MKEIDRAFKLMLTEYPDVLTVQEVAKILGCDDHQIYKMIDIRRDLRHQARKGVSDLEMQSDRLSDRGKVSMALPGTPGIT